MPSLHPGSLRHPASTPGGCLAQFSLPVWITDNSGFRFNTRIIVGQGAESPPLGSRCGSSLAAHVDGISGKSRTQGRARKETAMNHKVFFGSIAGVAVMLVGIGGTWVILNLDTVVAKALELGIKLAVQRGVQLTPETVKLLLELSGGAAGAAAGAAGQAAASTGQRAGKARQAGTGAGRRVTKVARSAG